MLPVVVLQQSLETLPSTEPWCCPSAASAAGKGKSLTMQIYAIMNSNIASIIDTNIGVYPSQYSPLILSHEIS